MQSGESQTMGNGAVGISPAAPGATQKYRTYLNEVETALAGHLSKRERRRLEGELALMQPAKFIELDGVVHHYQDVGPRDGEPLVLVHGWDCSAFWWHRIVGPLAEAGYRVIIYDLKGHGFSDSDPKAGYTVEGFSYDLHLLANALGLGKHHVAAFSLGAFVSLHYAATYPDDVRSVVFFNFSLLTYNSVASAMIPGLLNFVFNTVLRPIERRNLWMIPFVYARLVLSQHTPPVSDIRLGTLSLRCCDPQAVRVSASQLAQREILELLPQQVRSLRMPTLLVAGANDPIMQPSGGKKLIQLAPQGTYIEVPKCGHLILFELPDQVIAIMKNFLRQG